MIKVRNIFDHLIQQNFIASCQILDWEEGNYSINDSVGARGEIIIGGDHVSEGYFNMPSKTAEDFYEEDGKQFFRTGDIGQVLPDGNIKIVDRKKVMLSLKLYVCQLFERICFRTW